MEKHSDFEALNSDLEYGKDLPSVRQVLSVVAVQIVLLQTFCGELPPSVQRDVPRSARMGERRHPCRPNHVPMDGPQGEWSALAEESVPCPPTPRSECGGDRDGGSRPDRSSYYGSRVEDERRQPRDRSTGRSIRQSSTAGFLCNRPGKNRGPFQRRSYGF